MVPYRTEAELCADFAMFARADGWAVYPEPGGWDLVLVAGPHQAWLGAFPGDQVGVEAKLRPSMRVLRQATDRPHACRGPKYRAILVPDARSNRSDFRVLARRLGLVVFSMADISKASPRMPRLWLNGGTAKSGKQLELPEVAVDAPAGVPGPASVTPWKCKAIRLCMTLRKRGYVTVHDFRELSLDMSKWRSKKWLVHDGRMLGRAHVYVPGPEITWWDEKHPEYLAASIAAKYAART